jgi:uncharacterized protein
MSPSMKCWRLGATAATISMSDIEAIGSQVEYRIPLIQNARRFLAGHRIKLMLTSDDQPKDLPALLDYRHPPVGPTTRNTIYASSRLLLPGLGRHAGMRRV